jgi:hypothetical protein
MEFLFMEVGVIKLPVDVTNLPPFRFLRERLASASAALWVWVVTFQELLYRAQDGGPVGRFNQGEMDSVLGAIQSGIPEGNEVTTRMLVESGLLRPDGEDYVCPRFITLHGGVSGGPRSMAARGGDMRAFNLRQRQLEHTAVQQCLAIAERKFVDEEGKALDSEMTRKVTRLIIGCDNALFKSDRPPVLFTEGLIQQALGVLRRFTDEEINAVLTTVAGNRQHPALNGVVTERLLPLFGEMAGRLNGNR